MSSLPVNIVGSSTFGIYPKISVEKTYNMFISDGWMINYAGYRRLTEEADGTEGRALFNSIRGKFLIAVIDDKVYKVNSSLGAQQIGIIRTRIGEVFIDENLSSQICIVDGNNAWIFNYEDETFTQQTLDVGFSLIPGYVSYHNSFFLIAPSPNDPNNTNNWYAFQRETNSTISLVLNSVFPLQTKPDVCLAVERLPGRSNHVMVVGSSVCEVFTNVGGVQNYRRNSSFNIDSGCVSISTLAANEKFLCFLAQNESNSPTLLVTDGSDFKHISTDGIDNLFKTINRPDKSTAFFYRQDGHLFYQFTFFDPSDNVTFAYDFNLDKFYHITDDAMNFHPARQMVYFENKNLFVGLNRGSLYEMSIEIDGAIEKINSDEGRTIPRIRIPKTLRIPDSSRFLCKNFRFWMEQGVTSFSQLVIDQNCVGQMITQDGDEMITQDGDLMITEDGFCGAISSRPTVALTISRNGGQTFSNIVSRELNPQGNYKNIIQWYRLGLANELTFQLRFLGFNRFVVNNGVVEIEQ